MNHQDRNRLMNILKEHFQAFTIVGFDLDGRSILHTDYETDIQAHALTNRLSEYLREKGPATEVFVRNNESDE